MITSPFPQTTGDNRLKLTASPSRRQGGGAVPGGSGESSFSVEENELLPPLNLVRGVVSILCAREDSVYKRLPGCDVWDIQRNAWNFKGGGPVVAHPPCRIWGRLSYFCTGSEAELCAEILLGIRCVYHVRDNGGVLEHPAGSALWREMQLPAPGENPDRYGGWTLAAPQEWWGHTCEKKSWFYICGVCPRSIPAVPLRLDYPAKVIQSATKANHCSRAEREHTPLHLAKWLVELARCSVGTAQASLSKLQQVGSGGLA